MAATTFEEAKLCPKCELPGEDVSTSPAKDSRGAPVVLHMIWCRNDTCKWYNTSWVVQVNSDGTIPQAYSQIGDKKYPTISQESATRIEENYLRQLQAEVEPGAEVRNPRGN